MENQSFIFSHQVESNFSPLKLVSTTNYKALKFQTCSSPSLSCIDVCDLPILQKTDPNIRADAIDILARTLFVGPSREA